MKRDSEIQKNVMEELGHIHSLNASEVGVSVRNGIVTLSGYVKSYPAKVTIGRAVLSIKNVRGIAEELQVRLSDEDKIDDSNIAQAALYSLEWHSGLDPDKIQLMVEDGVVTITGTVDWDYQRKHAQKTVGNIMGVKNVINNLRLRVRPLPEQVMDKIKAAFLRNANIDAASIHVVLEGHKVILTGTVRSWLEKLEAENTVWSLPGIIEVDNQLEYKEAFAPFVAL